MKDRAAGWETCGRASGTVGRPCHNEMEFYVMGGGGVADFRWLWGGRCGMVGGVTCDSCWKSGGFAVGALAARVARLWMC